MRKRAVSGERKLREAKINGPPQLLLFPTAMALIVEHLFIIFLACTLNVNVLIVKILKR